jgi:hypothetical protein
MRLPNIRATRNRTTPPDARVAVREDDLRARERSIGEREDAVRLREEMGRAREGLVMVHADVDALLAELREANEQLVLANLRAQRSAEEAQHLAAIVESSNDAVISHTLDGIVTTWNRGAEGIFGYTAHEMIGRPAAILVPEGHPDELPAATERLRLGQAVERLESVRVRRDGVAIDVSLTVSPIRDEHGRLVGASTVACDVTRQRRAEEALQRSEALFRHLADAMPQIVWTARPDGYIDYYNQRWYAFTGFPEGHGPELWASLLHPDDVKPRFERFFSSIASGRPFQIEYRLRDQKTGGYRWFLGRAVAIRDDAGQITRWFGTCTDIDSLKRSEQERTHLLQREQAARAEAERANRLKDEFLATVSHELRTPLNAVMGWAKMLRAKLLDGDREAHAIEAIERNAVALTHIIEDLLDVSRIVAGSLNLASEPVEVATVLEAALEAVAPLASDSNIDLRMLGTPWPGEQVRGDADRLRQVFVNLLTNAVKFTPQGGQVTVTAARVDGWIQVDVSDTGKGIHPDFLPHVFEAFRQGDGGTSRQYTGLGLGLAIVRQLVELQGGTVAAASPGERLGATFTVQLPVADAAAATGRTRSGLQAPPANAPASREPDVRLDGVRILVVDDNSDGRTLTSLVLTQCGAHVREVTSAREAIAALGEERPDVIVSDIGLPDEDGYALLREIREQEAIRGGFLPVVALTGYARTEDRSRTLNAGFQAHVAKPFEPDDLVSTIAALIRGLV